MTKPPKTITVFEQPQTESDKKFPIKDFSYWNLRPFIFVYSVQVEIGKEMKTKL